MKTISERKITLCLLLSMIVTTGLEAQKRSFVLSKDSTHHIGGSTVVIDQKRINRGLMTNSLQALTGQAAGLNVQATGANRMAMLNSVRLRGTTSLTGGNEPLVIIDGVYSNLSTLSGIYPADIESFTILKNAAETAPYGSQGASGVIQVTTKKGQGTHFQISYDASFGIEAAYRQLDMLDAQSYVATARQLGKLYVDGGNETDFQKALQRTGFAQNHHIAFSGGSDKQQYRASLAYMGENTVIKNNDYRSFAAKLDLSQKAFDDHLTIDLGVVGSSQRNEDIFDEQKLFYSAATQNPTYPNGKNSSGGWDLNVNATQINNPIALLAEEDQERILTFNTHLKLNYRINKEWNLTAFGSYSFKSSENSQFKPTWVWAHGQADRAEIKTEAWLGNIAADWCHEWDVHHLDVKVMSEYQSTTSSGFNVTVRGLSHNSVTNDNLAAGSMRQYGATGSNYVNVALLSFLAQVEYSLMDKYTFTVNARTDGSSMFADDHKWGLFPSLSATWDLLKEPFFEDFDWLSQLKLRAGSGFSGNLGGITAYNTLALLYPTGLVPWYGNATVTYTPKTNPNPDLHWERRSSVNVGADVGFFDNKVVMTAEYYHSKTHDMLYLYDVPVPPYTFDKMLANLGRMSNQGFEMGIGYTPIHKRDMELNINLNMSYQKNKLISLSGNYNGTYFSAPDMASIASLNGAGFHGGNNNIVYQIVGQPLGVFYLPHCSGLVTKDDGTTTYAIEDLDGNGLINIEDGGDRYIAGQATPKWTLGSNISFRYYDFDISLQMNGAFGHKIYNGTSLSYMNMRGFPDYNVLTDAPKYNIYDQTATDYWLENGDYLNFDYLTVGWNIPIDLVTNQINSMRISFSINNLATITGYSGLTPMINSFAVNNTMGIDDKRSYPPFRSYSLAFSIQF
ncbi:MAG: SusC/RagA family TonB-linked outer membrane protein [Bacteroidales bacterium]|nr:SusC/RagA family TonB-linked outer membrane protein [Bacteroidales bacterium]